MRAVLALGLLAACAAYGQVAHHQRHRAGAKLSVPRSERAIRARHGRLMAGWAPPAHIATAAAAGAAWAPIHPAAYGADPTGVNDSTDAFVAAIAALLSRNASGHGDESGTIDLGGATLDLQGGDYLISAPLLFPSNFSNYAVCHGTLRASPSFPPSGFLVVIGTIGGYCENWGNSCTEDVTVEDMFLDGSQVAAGGIQFNAVIGVNAGPDLFVVNFTSVGVDMEGGHEVFLHESWVGSCWYTPPSACWLNGSALGSTVGILINGNDHLLSSVVVFAGLTGVQVNGAANLIEGVHTWNTQSGSVPAAVGIAVTTWQNRLLGPYLDYVPLVCKGCALTTVTGGFFLGGAQILFKPDPTGYPVQGVLISGNQFVALGDGQCDVVAVPGTPTFTTIDDVTIIGSMSDNPASCVKSTTAIQTLSTTNGTWRFDFTSRLLFDPATHPIQNLLFSCTSGKAGDAFGTGCAGIQVLSPVGGVVQAMATAFNGTTPFNGTLTITVDQSTRK
jgi:hypothetical protein